MSRVGECWVTEKKEKKEARVREGVPTRGGGGTLRLGRGVWNEFFSTAFPGMPRAIL